MQFLPLAAFVLLQFFSSTTALRAVPNQQCAASCGDVTNTKTSEVVCNTNDLQNTPTGQQLQSCLNCQVNSTANDPNTGESDLRWFTYNVRFIMSTCLFGFGNYSQVLSTPCTTTRACGPYEGNIEYNALLPNASTFDYCTGFDSRTNGLQPQCTECLKALKDEFFIANFFIALVAGCQQRPSAGSFLSLQGRLFGNTLLNITTPQPTSLPTGFASSTTNMTLGAMVGAAAGALVLILILLGCCIVFFGKRRRRAAQESAKERARQQKASMPLGGHVETGVWGETPTTAGGYRNDKVDFSPYISQYTSPVSARDMLNPKQLWEAHEAKMVAMEETTKAQQEAIMMEKMRDAKIRDRRLRDAQLHEEFLQEAASKGFTTAPILKTPHMGREGLGLGLSGLGHRGL